MATVERPKAGSAGAREPQAGQRPSRGNGTGITAAMSRYRRIGLDTVVFIYHLSNHSVYGRMTEELFGLIESGQITAVTSSLALVEILARPKQLGHQAAVDSYRSALATFPNLELRRSDIAVTEQAADLRARYRLSTPEAIQLATAVVDGADAFLGNTPALRAVRELDVHLLDDLLARRSSPSRTRA